MDKLINEMKKLSDLGTKGIKQILEEQNKNISNNPIVPLRACPIVLLLALWLPFSRLLLKAG